MWKCANCNEEIEDKYKHCWNCGQPHAQAEPVFDDTNFRAVVDEPPPEEKKRSGNDFSPAAETLPKQEFLFERGFSSEAKPPSKIKMVLVFGLWLAAFVAVLGFTYFSHQKMKAFTNQNLEDAKNLESQKNQFIFNKDAPRGKGDLKTKVLPLNAENNEIDGLFYQLPDDLRPANIEEVQTILWLDCKNDKVWVYEDDSLGYREKCNGYLVDRDTSKITGVEAFLGEMPPLSKKWGTGDAYGKVLPERYISYLKANQPESERTAQRFASDSPNHHFFSKSELFYSVILLCLLGAVGLGALAYKLKFSDWDMG